jgi:hypothetical protein
MEWNVIHNFINQMVEEQKQSVLLLGRKFVPNLTPEDMLQPNDYPELEEHPVFRYEEGILAGLQSVQIVLKSMEREESKDTGPKKRNEKISTILPEIIP